MNLKKKTILGMMWSGASQAGRQTSQFIITAILARLLTPTDFGLIGMATVFTGFVSMINEMGVAGALIQNQSVEERHFSSVFWLNIFVGVMLMSTMMLLAHPIAVFYDNPELKPILMVLSTNFVIASFSTVQQTIFQKSMDFKKLAIAETISVILGGFVGIYFALKGSGVWSLVYQMIAFTLSNMILLWSLSRWRPKLIFSWSAIHDIFHFSANLTGFNMLNYIARNVDYLLIGKFLGAQSLGYYTLAYKLMLVPLQNLSWTIDKVTFPAFSMIQEDKQKITISYVKLIKIISLVSFPLMMGLFVLSREFVNTVYGSQWIPAVDLVRIFCVCGLVQSVGSTTGLIYKSLGRADLHFKMGLVNTCLSTLFIVLGLKWGILGVAVLYSTYSVFWVNYSFLVVAKLLSLKYRIFYLSMEGSFLCSALMLSVIFFIKNIIVIYGIVRLLEVSVLGVCFYGFLLLATKQIYLSSDRKVSIA